VILYWIVSIGCIALTSLLTGALASFAPAGHPFHLLVVAIGYPIVMLTFWLIKFVIYQRVIFRTAPTEWPRREWGLATGRTGIRHSSGGSTTQGVV